MDKTIHPSLMRILPFNREDPLLPLTERTRLRLD